MSTQDYAELEEIALDLKADRLWKENRPSSLSEQIELLKKCGLCLKHIKMRNEGIINTAIVSNGLALKYVEYPEKGDIAIAIRTNGLALRYADDHDKAMEFIAVRNNGLALKYCKYRDVEMCVEAIYQNYKAIVYCQDIFNLTEKDFKKLLFFKLSKAVIRTKLMQNIRE